MKPSILTTAALSLLALALPLHADDGDGWISLFDGTSLDGWKESGETPDCFSIDEDGSLKVSGGRAHLFYVGQEDGDGTFANFELKLRAKTLPQANSGVYFHTEFQAEGWPQAGYECQVNATQKDPKKTGSLYAVENIYVKADDKEHAPGTSFEDEKTGLNHARESAPNTDGEWFDYHIIVDGKTIELRIDGETTVKYTEPADGSLANPGMPGRKLGSGLFALQAHDPDSTTFYQDIRVKRLP